MKDVAAAVEGRPERLDLALDPHPASPGWRAAENPQAELTRIIGEAKHLDARMVHARLLRDAVEPVTAVAVVDERPPLVVWPLS